MEKLETLLVANRGEVCALWIVCMDVLTLTNNVTNRSLYESSRPRRISGSRPSRYTRLQMRRHFMSAKPMRLSFCQEVTLPPILKATRSSE